MRGFEPGKRRRAEHGDRLDLQCDVCIVGAGAGGSAVAAALAERGLDVVVLEEGQHWNPSDFQSKTRFALKNLYQGRGLRSCRGNAITLMPGGRGVGGSTLINSAICFRCPDPVLKSWREEHGCETLEPARMNGYFDRVWSTLGVSVNPVAVQRNNNLIFKEGVEALGLEGGAFMARSAPGCVGCGLCQYGCPSGGKYSADRTFMAEALATGRVGVYSDCRMRGVETDGDRVTAVTGFLIDPDTHAENGEVRVTADHFVISGGPVGSPLFLLANGLAENTHCGQHLVVHPTVAALARFPQEIRPWSGVTQGYYVDCWEKGFLLQTFTVTPDNYYIALQTGMGEETMRIMKDLAHLASAGALVHDEDSAGRVQHTPVGPDLSYFLGDGDKKRLIDGMRLTAEVFFAAGATRVHPGRVGLTAIERPEDIEASLPYDMPASHLFLYASHPMGTCRMGADPETSVVDPRGRVWGWSNLSVADASIFPTSLGVNPQVTTMALGLMVGHTIAG
ncbi:MAG: GMC family oxidoreductase [Alphaproteobacteria bacterium]|nr:GMC family oxidoreductase [Alphaproteobacteria bacterium]